MTDETRPNSKSFTLTVNVDREREGMWYATVIGGVIAAVGRGPTEAQAVENALNVAARDYRSTTGYLALMAVL